MVDVNLFRALAAAIRLRRDREVGELAPLAWAWYPTRRHAIRSILGAGGYPQPGEP